MLPFYPFDLKCEPEKNLHGIEHQQVKQVAQNQIILNLSDLFRRQKIPKNSPGHAKRFVAVSQRVAQLVAATCRLVYSVPLQ